MDLRLMLSRYIAARSLEGHPAVGFLREFVEMVVSRDGGDIVTVAAEIEAEIRRVSELLKDYRCVVDSSRGNGAGVGIAMMESAIVNARSAILGADRMELYAALAALRGLR